MELIPSDKELIQLLEEDYDPLPETVKKHLSNVALNYMYGILMELDRCESPIEHLLGIELHRIFPYSLSYVADDYFITSQDVIECGEKEYRVDFFIAVLKNKKDYGFVVECDGHDFHEKTKEQAKRDKQRDRDLAAKGHLVIRFTGSEIFKDPERCAREVVKIIRTYIKG